MYSWLGISSSNCLFVDSKSRQWRWLLSYRSTIELISIQSFYTKGFFDDRINYAWCLVNLKVQILFDGLLIKSFSRPLKCTVPITFKRTTALNNTRPRVIKMKPINSIRHKYKPQLTSTKKPPESREELYKYKPKFAIRNILHRSRHGRLNKLLSNISI